MQSENILSEFTAGDERSFRLAYDKYVQLLRFFARKYLGDAAAVEDVLQEVFVSLWEKRRSFPSEAALKSFLYVGVKNRCLNILRHEKVQTAHAGSLSDDMHEDFLGKVIETEFFDMLFSLVGELPPASREVYRHSLDGKKNEEIAALLDISVNTVKKYKVNANQYLRSRIKDLALLISLC